MKNKLLFLGFILFFFAITSNSFAVFSNFGYPTSSSGKKTFSTSLWLGESWSFARGHLGEDYALAENEPVYAVADGTVFKVANWPECPYSRSYGWGGVVIIKHQIPDNIDKYFDTTNAVLQGSPAISNPKVVYSMHAHLKNIQASEGQEIKKGTKLGDIGRICKKDGGTYIPHLHFEIKDQNSINREPEIGEISGVGTGYSGINGFAPNRYIPSKFIENNKSLIIQEETKSPTQKAKDIVKEIIPSPGVNTPENPLSLFEKTGLYIKNFLAKAEKLLGINPINGTNGTEKGTNPLIPPFWYQKFLGKEVKNFIINEGEDRTDLVIFQFQNLGNTAWKQNEVYLGVIGGSDGTAAKFYYKNWVNKTVPCTIKESRVGPGNVATFELKINFPNQVGKYYPQFIPIRYDKDNKKWVIIPGDKAVFLAEVKKKSSGLDFTASNVNQATSSGRQSIISQVFHPSSAPSSIINPPAPPQIPVQDLKITDLDIVGFFNKTILLFSPPRENLEYEVYFANQNFQEKDFENLYSQGAIKKVSSYFQEPYIKKGPFKNESGRVQIEIENLSWMTSYFFVVRAKEGNNYSRVSNVVSYESPSAVAISSFPMFRHDPQGTNSVSFLGPFESPKITSFIVGEYIETPTISKDGKLYFNGTISGRQGIYSVTPNGEERFFFEGGFYGMPTLFEAEKLVYVVGGNSLIAINTDSGQKVWEKHIPFLFGITPIIDDYGRMYLIAGVCIKGQVCNTNTPSVNGGLLSLNPKNGNINWFFSPDENRKYLPNEISFEETIPWFLPPHYTYPAVNKNGIIYFAKQHTFFSISPLGDLLAQRKIQFYTCNPSRYLEESTPYFYINEISIGSDSTVYFSTEIERYLYCGSWSEAWYGCLHGVSPDILEDKWFDCSVREGAYFPAPFTVGKNDIISYFPVKSGFFDAKPHCYRFLFDKNGNILNYFSFDISGYTSGLLADGENNVYISMGGGFYVIKPNGDRFNLPFYSTQPFSMSENGTIYIGSEGTLYAIYP